MRRKDETLREKLLDIAREIVRANGTEAINIRAIAKQAGVATGTVYNYFSDKNEILLALTEEYWRNAMTEMRGAIHAESFSEQLKEIYDFLIHRIADWGGMMMAGLNQTRAGGQEKMQSMHKVLRGSIMRLIQQDNNIATTIWTKKFGMEQYADFIIANLMIQLRSKSSDIDFFIEIIKRTLYK